MLPLDLMELIDYATNCMKIHAKLLRQSKVSHIMHLNLQFPPLPSGLAGRLAELIEAADDENTNLLIALVRRLQIQHARARSIQYRATNQHGSILLRHNLIRGSIDAAEIYARCDKLFKWVRGNMDVVATILPNDLKTALLLMPTGLSDMDELNREIDRIAATNQNENGWPET